MTGPLLVDILYEGRLEAAGVALTEAFPTNDDPEGFARAYADLVTHGEHHCGGGAAPHFILRFHGSLPGEEGALRDCVETPA